LFLRKHILSSIKNGCKKHSQERSKVLEEEIKYYVLVKDGCRHFAPQHLSVGATTVEWIFPVPEPHAVGTLDRQSNGIVFIKFGGYGVEPKRNVVAKDFSSEVYGREFDYRFCQNFSDDTVVYCKTRVAVVANVKTGEAFHAECGLSLDDYLRGISFLDPQKKLFVIVKTIDEGGRGEWKDYLHIAKLEGQEFIDAGWSMYTGKTDDDDILPHFPLYDRWRVHGHKLFVYDREWHKIVCTDGKASVLHPFSEVFNANANLFGTVKDIAIHPRLPFGAIIVESAPNAHHLVVLRWDITKSRKKAKQIISLSQELEQVRYIFNVDRVTLAYQSFSPDGNWYVVGFIAPNKPQSPYFIAIPVTPVNRKRPNFLDMGNLVVLGQVAGLTSIAWTSSPTSYVVSDGARLHKWDLDELPNARVFVVPEDGAVERKPSIFRRIARWFGFGK
jgi:hypothetical protein